MIFPIISILSFTGIHEFAERKVKARRIRRQKRRDFISSDKMLAVYRNGLSVYLLYFFHYIFDRRNSGVELRLCKEPRAYALKFDRNGIGGRVFFPFPDYAADRPRPMVDPERIV